ncbi:MAG: DUF962 domain-containing protein [Pseudomonadota bacterium]
MPPSPPPTPTGESTAFADYDAFWLHYLAQHRRRGTRRLHYVGTTLGVLCVLVAALRLDWRFLAAAPLVGYAFAWTAHFGLEGNKPATFGHPLWSFVSDFRMLALAATGRLERQLERLKGG